MGSHSPFRTSPSLGDPADLRASAWLDLDRIWQLDPPHLSSGSLPVSLSPGWRLLLMGDGHTTRNLQILTGQPIEAHVIESQRIEHPEQEMAPLDLSGLGHPLIRRQVWLGPTDTDQPLLYAVSWWNQERLQATLPDPNQPIGRSLMSNRRESFRELHGVFEGHHPNLTDLFQQTGPFLGRHYLLWQGGQPLTLIYEVFSPSLSFYLDPFKHE